MKENTTMNKEMIERIENVRSDLQVTLKFEFCWTGVLDKAVLKRRVQERLLPIIKLKIFEGTVWLRDVPFVETDRFSTVVRSGHADLPVAWTAHRPWWAEDNQDWDKVPFASLIMTKEIPRPT